VSCLSSNFGENEKTINFKKKEKSNLKLPELSAHVNQSNTIHCFDDKAQGKNLEFTSEICRAYM